jgi:hypothetical protein
MHSLQTGWSRRIVVVANCLGEVGGAMQRRTGFGVHPDFAAWSVSPTDAGMALVARWRATDPLFSR